MVLKHLAFLSIFAISSSVFAETDPNKLVLDDNIRLSAVCWGPARESGWLDVSHYPGIVASDYGLLVRLEEKPTGPFPFSTEPFLFRLIVRNFPCYYEYETHQYRLHGTDLMIADWSPPDVTVRGASFPGVAPAELVTPVIERLLDQCELRHKLSPFLALGNDCTQLVRNDLITATTSISIFPNSADPSEFEQVIFVRGFPYLDGLPLFPYPMDVLKGSVSE